MYPYNLDSNTKKSSFFNPLQNENIIQAQSQNLISIDDKLIEMIDEALEDETTDSDFYNALSKTIDDESDSQIIYSLSLDELKHKRFFEELYKLLMGANPPKTNPEPSNLSPILIDNFSDHILSELDGVEFYRKIYQILDEQAQQDMLFEIITDEQAHAIKLNYLYSKYK